MIFCFTFGSHKFTKEAEEYKGRRYVCRCGSGEAYCRKSWEWFTICWIPAIPYSLGWDKEVHCPTCGQVGDLQGLTPITPGQGGQGLPLQQGMMGGYGGPQQQQGTMGGYGVPQQQQGKMGGYGGPPQQQGMMGGYGGPPQQQGMMGGYGGPPQQQGTG